MLLKRPSQIQGLPSNEPFSELNWEGNQHTLKKEASGSSKSLPIQDRDHTPCFPSFYQLSKHREIPGEPGWQQSHPAFQLPDGFVAVFDCKIFVWHPIVFFFQRVVFGCFEPWKKDEMESFQKLDVCTDSVSSKNLEALYTSNRVNLNQTSNWRFTSLWILWTNG